MPNEPEPHNRFNRAADAYIRARPPYPPEVVEWIAETAGLRAGGRVLDLGAGTGELTVRLIEAGFQVEAVEPSEPMRAILESRLEGISVSTDRTEDLTSFADAGFDLVTAANSLHWFDPEAAYPEILRVLRPTGHMAVVWHLPDRSDPLQDRLWRLVEHLHASAAPYPGPVPGGDAQWGGRFELIGDRWFDFVHRLAGEYLPDYIGSWSGVANLEEAEKAALLDEVRGWSVADVVELPFRIQALVGSRIAPGSGRTR